MNTATNAPLPSGCSKHPVEFPGCPACAGAKVDALIASTERNQETGTRYSHAELKAAFERVEDRTNWKNPIVGALIPAAERDVTEQAVIFFAGCRPTFRAAKRTDHDGRNGQKAKRGDLLVDAAGYYLAVGA